ncbi:Myb family transcription factor EFM [Dichanthelium oligosanthes]|uniref:Myb family transcription factor EFM n=1 Tax=Dichanthelium oligosanthes TaxID=888268 RepID=A0A1E5UQ02_9POAL|nr:Myb family transcription factor EFM [Dichanthelium oligosanthes]
MEMDPPFLHADRRRCREYLLALEEERRKIQVFRRELPLCLDLVTQTIEGMKSQMDGVGSEETVSDHGPVLEEFMPLKPSLSLSSSEEHDSAHDAAATTNGGVGKNEEAAETPSPPTTETKKQAPPDWLQSVQLWSQEPTHKVYSTAKLYVVWFVSFELPCKPVALNARKAGGAFQPFEKEKRAELPASSTTAAASSAVVEDDSCDKAGATESDTAAPENHSDKQEMNKDAKDKAGKDNKDKADGQSQAANRKPRRCWAPELHRRFLQALQQLGGSHVATPKQIRELMKVDGLTNDEVKSHLQKYRLHTRRPNTTALQSTSPRAAPPAPQFVVVGGIWVPPPEYVAAAAAAAAAAAQPQVQLGAGDASGTANTVYAPVATLPSGLRPRSLQQGQRQSSRCSDGRRSGDASSDSPAVSSSSHTTSA